MHYHIPLMQILTDDLYLNYTSFPAGQEVVPPPSLAQILYLYVSLSSQGYEWVSLYRIAGNSASVLIHDSAIWQNFYEVAKFKIRE